MTIRAPRRTGGAHAKRPYLAAPERRDQIVAATIAIITEQGLHEWKTADLAARVGLSEPALFRHFPNKRAILTAAVRRETAALRQLVLTFDAPGDGWTRVTGLVTTVLAFIESTGGGPLVILTGQLWGASSATLREIQKTLGVLRQQLTSLSAQALKETRQTGAIPPEDLADLAIAVIQSAALRWIMSGRVFPMQARARAMLAVARGAIPSMRRTG